MNDSNVVPLKQRQAHMVHALEAEQGLLGALMMNNDGVALVAGMLEPKHFFEPLHARIYDAILTGVRAGNKVSAVTLAPWFRDDPTIKSLGGDMSYLARLAGTATTIINAQGYAQLLLDTWVRRESLNLLEGLAIDLANAGPSAGEAVKTVQETLAQIAASADVREHSRRQSAGLIGEDVLNDINASFQSGEPANTGAKIGLSSVAHMLGSWERQALILLAARPSMGKTTVATSLALKTAEVSGEDVLFFSLEMSRKQLTYRMLSDLAWEGAGQAIPYSRIAKHKLSETEFERIADANRKLKLLPITIDDRGRLSVDQMFATAQSEKRRIEAKGRRLGLIIVDHGLLIAPREVYRGNRVDQIADITAGLKAMAKALDTCVVCLVQLNRGVESRDNKRPGLADLRGSGAWEEDADAVAFVYREAYYLERLREDDPLKEDRRVQRLEEVRNKLELLLEKNRMGETGVIELFVNMPASVVRDLERRYG